MSLETYNKEELAKKLIKNDYKGYYAKHKRRYVYLVTNNCKVGTRLSEEAIKTIKEKTKKADILSATKWEIERSLYGTVTQQGPITTKTENFLD